MTDGRIRRCGADDATAILGVINDAAEAYRGVIPERQVETSVVLADRRWRRQVRRGTQ